MFRNTNKEINTRIFKSRHISDEASLLIIFLSLIMIMSIILPRFRTLHNILTVIRQFSLVAIVAMGESVVLISGGFDLSVGSIAALTGIFSCHLMVTFMWPIWISVFLGILLGALCGVFNGVLITKVKINPLIATLASSWIFMGVILITTKGWPVINMPQKFNFLGQGYFLGIPFPIIIMIVVGVILTIFLSQTIYGRFIYAIGGNVIASKLSGLNVDRMKIIVFVLCDSLAALAGIILCSRMGYAQASNGENWPLPAIAAAVIGGVSLSGGKGKIYGVAIGAALLGIISNILVLLHISSYWQSLISGFIVIGAVSIDAIRKSREELYKKRRI